MPHIFVFILTDLSGEPQMPSETQIDQAIDVDDGESPEADVAPHGTQDSTPSDAWMEDSPPEIEGPMMAPEGESTERNTATNSSADTSEGDPYAIQALGVFILVHFVL